MSGRAGSSHRSCSSISGVWRWAATLPGAGDPLLGVDHDVGDQARPRERREAQ
jgi:hypothetical protein